MDFIFVTVSPCFIFYLDQLICQEISRNEWKVCQKMLISVSCLMGLCGHDQSRPVAVHGIMNPQPVIEYACPPSFHTNIYREWVLMLQLGESSLFM